MKKVLRPQKTMEELSASNLKVKMSKMKSILQRRHTVVDPRELSSSSETNKRVIYSMTMLKLGQ